MTTSHIKTMSNVELKYVYLLNFQNVFLAQNMQYLSLVHHFTHFSPDKHGKMDQNLGLFET